MRALRLIAFVAVFAALLTGTARADTPERVELVTHVFPETGHRVVAVSLRYDEPVWPQRASFAVTATIDGVTAPRTVTGVSRGRDARSLLISLDPADANAGASQ